MMKNKTKKKNYVKYSRAYDNPPIVYICFIIMGLVFVLICAVIWHEGRLIDRSEAIQASGTYDTYIVHKSIKSGNATEIEICFLDRENLFMDNAYWSVNIEDAFNNLKKGDAFDMLLHPVSGYIWQITYDDGVLISFEDARDGVLIENIGYSVIFGGFGSLCFIMGSVCLFLWLRQHKLLKNENAKTRSRK